MNVQHLADGRTVADTAAMAALTQRPPWSVRSLCQRDEHGYDMDACIAALNDNPTDPVLVTAAEAQQYLGVPAGSVRGWASLGRLVSRQRDFRGYPLYDAAHIIDLARRPQ